MIAELIAVVALVVSVGALLWRTGSTRPGEVEPLPLDETSQGQALIAIKDLEFDHATGKVAEADYQSLRDRFVREAAGVLATEPDPVEAFLASRKALAAGRTVACARCGPRPEPDARYCSSCGALIG
ncbi:MAG: hypothetical protein FJ206_14880 [Gemmatimonadetes bacterium]|nr:hypothetical protein [Gemmatimonadota bacterium]